jgi:regulator of nucleoside diphosphate kinase
MSKTLTQPIYLCDRDYENLRVRIAAFTDSRSRRLTEKLRHEIERAVVVPVAALPPEVVRIGSKVCLYDLDTQEHEEYILTLPEQADPSQGRLSVLAPLGTAIIGFAATAEIDWEMPGGVRRLRIERVDPPAAPPRPI